MSGSMSAGSERTRMGGSLSRSSFTSSAAWDVPQMVRALCDNSTSRIPGRVAIGAGLHRFLP